MLTAAEARIAKSLYRRWFSRARCKESIRRKHKGQVQVLVLTKVESLECTNLLREESHC